MADSFFAPLDAIDDQIDYVRGVQEKAGTANDAAGQIRTQDFDLAYGVLCQAFPATIKPVEDSCVDTIARITESLRHTTEKLEATAKSYRDADQSIMDEVAKLLTRLNDR